MTYGTKTASLCRRFNTLTIGKQAEMIRTVKKTYYFLVCFQLNFRIIFSKSFCLIPSTFSIKWSCRNYMMQTRNTYPFLYLNRKWSPCCTRLSSGVPFSWIWSNSNSICDLEGMNNAENVTNEMLLNWCVFVTKELSIWQLCLFSCVTTPKVKLYL